MFVEKLKGHNADRQDLKGSTVKETEREKTRERKRVCEGDVKES